MLSLTVRAVGSMMLCLSVAVASAGESGLLDRALDVAQTANFAPTIAAPATDGSAIQATEHHASPDCTVSETPVTATCCQPIEYNAASCQSCSSGRCGHKGCCWKKWCHFHSTCDLYPHYAYYPEHHGYYYFRPYNYTTLLEHKEIALQLGVDPANPYSVSLLDPLMAEFDERYPPRNDTFEQVLPQRKPLPLLEALLEKK